MQSSWHTAGALIQVDGLADVLGERHRIISNDWLAAHMNSLIGVILTRAADILEHVDFAPAALRRDLAGGRVAAHRLYSAAELIARAADLCSDSAGLVHDRTCPRQRTPLARHARTHRTGLQAMSASAEPATGDVPQPTSGPP